jgi:hypothetical protein
MGEDAAVWTERDDKEIEYGKWYVYDPMTSFAETNKIHPPKSDEIWPHWNEGVPRILRKQWDSPSFILAAVHHRNNPEYYVTLTLRWNVPYMLSVLRKNYRLLPGTYTSEWSGVYRIFSPNTTIDRCCGKDPTGTLYIGRAGSDRGWSILRNRLMSIVRPRGGHHATDKWSFSDAMMQKFPWTSLAVEWAYTGKRANYKGEPVAEAILAERLLLQCYVDSYGELPPWNDKG